MILLMWIAAKGMVLKATLFSRHKRARCAFIPIYAVCLKGSSQSTNWRTKVLRFIHSGNTFAAMLLEQRENLKIVAGIMGHKRANTTLNLYSHVVNNDVYVKTAQTLDGVYASFIK